MFVCLPGCFYSRHLILKFMNFVSKHLPIDNDNMIRKHWPLMIKWRSFSSSKKTHYEVLGLKPHATHTEIKGAYYYLSKQHHPDMNTGNIQRFRDISDAYEVLSDPNMRRIYDKANGVLRSEKMSHNTYRSHESNKTVKPRVVYNYEGWITSHYSQRMQATREDLILVQMIREIQDEHNDTTLSLLFVILFIVLVPLAFYISYLKPPDKNGNENEKSNSTDSNSSNK